MSTAAKYNTAAPLASSKVDAEAGIIRDVALVSIGEASGHSTRIDQKTLEMFYALVKGQTVKAFVNHSDNPKPTEAIGIYSGFYIDVEAGVLRASQFQAFKAFRENSKEAYDTLFEMAETAPESFGISANFYLDLEKAEDGGDPYARPTHVESFDIVCTPAANKALFSRNSVDNPPASSQPLICNETKSQEETSTTNPIFPMKAIYAKFKDNTKALARACQLAAETPDVKEDEVIAKVEGEIEEEAYQALVTERDTLKAENERLSAEIAELKPKADKEAELSAQVAELSKKSGEQAAQIAQFEKARSRYGIRPVVTDKSEGEQKVELKGIARTAAAFAKTGA